MDAVLLVAKTVALVCLIFALIVVGNAALDRIAGVGFDVCPHLDGCRPN